MKQGCFVDGIEMQDYESLMINVVQICPEVWGGRRESALIRTPLGPIG